MDEKKRCARWRNRFFLMGCLAFLGLLAFLEGGYLQNTTKDQILAGGVIWMITGFWYGSAYWEMRRSGHPVLRS